MYDVKGFQAVWLASRKIESNARKQNSQQAVQILLSTEDTDHYQWYEDLRVILVVWIDKFRAFYKKSCACEMLIKYTYLNCSLKLSFYARKNSNASAGIIFINSLILKRDQRTSAFKLQVLIRNLFWDPSFLNCQFFQFNYYRFLMTRRENRRFQSCLSPLF